jgi:hypothetical protein
MFKMIVSDAIKIHDNLASVAGECINRNEFTNRLIDESGNVYNAHIPLGGTISFDDKTIMLGIIGNYDAKSLLGRTLSGAT